MYSHVFSIDQISDVSDPFFYLLLMFVILWMVFRNLAPVDSIDVDGFSHL